MPRQTSRCCPVWIVVFRLFLAAAAAWMTRVPFGPVEPSRPVPLPHLRRLAAHI